MIVSAGDPNGTSYTSRSEFQESFYLKSKLWMKRAETKIIELR